MKRGPLGMDPASLLVNAVRRLGNPLAVPSVNALHAISDAKVKRLRKQTKRLTDAQRARINAGLCQDADQFADAAGCHRAPLAGTYPGGEDQRAMDEQERGEG